MTNEEAINAINTWIGPMRKSLKGTLTHEFLDAVEALERKEIRYAWHDLRKNPNDFPEAKEQVILCLANFSSTAYEMCNINRDGEWVYWNNDTLVFDDYEKDWWKPVAWKMICEFEEE